MTGMCTSVILIIILVGMVLFFSRKKQTEGFDLHVVRDPAPQLHPQLQQPHLSVGASVAQTIVGGIVSYQHLYPATSKSPKTVVSNPHGDTTLVRKLLGNSGQTIVLLHNSPFDQQVWYSLFTYTQVQYREGKRIPTLISYDLRGHGTAWVPVDPRFNDADPKNVAWTLDSFAEDLDSILQEYVPTGRVTLVGYGVGSRIASVYSITHPERIDALFVLQSGFGHVGDTSGEIEYFSNWVNAHPTISYLTIPESYVRIQMCKWFQTLDTKQCPDNNDRVEHAGTTEYLLADKLWRTASATSFLQVTKIGTGNTSSKGSLRERWAAVPHGSLPFKITILTADRDNYVTPADAKEDLQTLQSIGANATLDIVEGKHGYVVTHTYYIYDLITAG